MCFRPTNAADLISYAGHRSLARTRTGYETPSRKHEQSATARTKPSIGPKLSRVLRTRRGPMTSLPRMRSLSRSSRLNRPAPSATSTPRSLPTLPASSRKRRPRRQRSVPQSRRARKKTGRSGERSRRTFPLVKSGSSTSCVGLSCRFVLIVCIYRDLTIQHLPRPSTVVPQPRHSQASSFLSRRLYGENRHATPKATLAAKRAEGQRRKTTGGAGTTAAARKRRAPAARFVRSS